jgi:urea transport system substrate-binding protein
VSSSFATRAADDAQSAATQASAAASAAGDDDTPRILQKLLSPPVLGNELGWLGHYKVKRVLGRGGMGLVLLAEDSHLQRPVALKVMLPAMAERSDARDRFLREARAVAKLRDEHIVVIYQVGQERDVPYLAMEYLEGQSLEQCVRAGRPAIADVLRIGRAIATGLAVAHQAGVVHRDVKPANIFLARGAASPCDAPSDAPLDIATAKVKILDFGLARPLADNLHLTGSGQLVGTPYFMSPEQARGESVDARSDLFSLGVLLYYLTTGRLPFAGEGMMAVLTALAVQTPPPLCSLRPETPPALEELVRRLLEKDPANRPATAREVVAALAQIELQLASLKDTGVIPATAVGLPAMAAPISGAASAPSASAPSTTAPHTAAPTAPPTQVSQTGPGRARPWWRVPAAAALGLVAVLLCVLAFFGRDPAGPATDAGAPIRIGVLHSRTGTMAISERPVIDAVRLAVEEVNAQGGVLGRTLEAIFEDGQSDDDVFAAAAEKLIAEDKVATIFGCWTSSSRKAVKAVVERHDHLLMYPVESEGMELSPNIVYGGATPNQQILPAVRWSVGFLNKRRWFLVGSDYVFPHAANEVIKDEAKALGCTIAGEEYLHLGSTDVAGVVGKIRVAQPDLIINTINGDTNVAFFRALRKAKITPAQAPTISFSIDDTELGNSLPPRDLVGDLVAGGYFDEVDRPQSRKFVEAFREHYGPRSISDAMQTAYYSVHLWADAVRAAGSAEPKAILAALKGRRIDAPQGVVQIDPTTLYTVQHARIGRFQLADDNTIRIEEVFVTPQPIAPVPYPASRSREAWDGFLQQLHEKWGGRWTNPER